MTAILLCLIVIADKPGQLGNRLTVFAHFVALATEYGITVADPALDEYASHFRGSSGDLLCRFPQRASRVRPSRRRRRITYLVSLRFASILNLLPKKSILRCRLIRLPFEERLTLSEASTLRQRNAIVLVQGWLFRDETLLCKHAEVVRNYFAPVDTIVRTVNRKLDEARRTTNVLVGIHIRQGDYNETRGRKYFYSTTQYVEVMRRLLMLFEDASVRFLVCSNVVQEAEDFGELPVTFGSGEVVEDLYELAGCDYIVGPPSSFSLWASFMGSKPLLMLTDITRHPDLGDFVVAPGIRDPEVRHDY